jgi:hypothetical protein
MSENRNDQDRPAIRRDFREALREMHRVVLDKENALIWKAIALQVALIAAIFGAQWAFHLLHFKQ